MVKTKFVNLLLVIAAVLVVAVFAFSVRLEAAADSVTLLKADGITCGNCAAAISKALEAEKGVASVTVDESAGKVVVGYDSKAVTPEALSNRVTSTGYGCRILQVQTMAEYRLASGGEVPARPAKGCCCSKNRQKAKE